MARFCHHCHPLSFLSAWGAAVDVDVDVDVMGVDVDVAMGEVDVVVIKS